MGDEARLSGGSRTGRPVSAKGVDGGTQSPQSRSEGKEIRRTSTENRVGRRLVSAWVTRTGGDRRESDATRDSGERTVRVQDGSSGGPRHPNPTDEVEVRHGRRSEGFIVRAVGPGDRMEAVRAVLNA